MKNLNKYIGVSGVARSGKNLFCDIASDLLSERGIDSRTFSLAYYLKKDCEVFIREKFGLDVWSEKTEDKNIFRPLLIWYGSIKRTQSNGRCWIEKLNSDIKMSTATVNFVSDIRFAFHKNDEVSWIKSELGGTLVHLSKFHYEGHDRVKIYTPPAGEDERLNEPRLVEQCNYELEWEHSNSHVEEARQDPQLRQMVAGIIDRMFIE